MQKKWLFLGLKGLVSVALIWWLLASIDFGAAVDRVMASAPGFVVAAILLFLVQIVIGGLRWKVVLAALGAHVPLWRLVRLFYVGVFFNQALPSSVGGDAVRMYAVWRDGIGFGSAIGGVLLERLATVVALVLIMAAGTPLLVVDLDADATRLVLGVVGAFVLATIVGMWLLVALDRLPRRWLGLKLVRGLGRLAKDARLVFLQGATVLPVMFWAIVGQVNMIAVVYVLGLGLGLPITIAATMVVVPAALLVATLPISIAGWGVREGVMVAGFAMVGLAAEGVLAVSILYGLLSIATGLPGGLLWLTGDRTASDVPDLWDGLEQAGDQSADGGINDR